MKTLFFFLITVSMYLLISCEIDDSYMNDQFTNNEENFDLNTEQKNELIEKYAHILALSMESSELRSVIKKEAKIRFDGDYDILTKTFESLPLVNRGMLVKDLLLTTNNNEAIQLMNSSTGNDFNGNGYNIFDMIERVFPNLQISVPIHCEEWDTKTHIPLVAYLPYDYDEQTTKEVVAYDYLGNKHMLSVDIEPKEAVIVVGISERVDKNGDLLNDKDELFIIPGSLETSLKSAPAGPATLTLQHGYSNQIILEWQDVANETMYEVWRMLNGQSNFEKLATTSNNDNNYVSSIIRSPMKAWFRVRAVNPDGPSSWSPVMATTYAQRYDQEYLKIKQMTFSTSALKKVEKWLSGAPEIKLRVVRGSEGGANAVYTSGYLEPPRRRDIENSWWEHEVPLFTWATNVYGTVLTFDWREHDWEDNVTFTISASYEDKSDNGTIKYGGSITFENKAEAGHIGNTAVLWWHSRSMCYDLSGFKWTFVY
ncbi:MAG: hypothetical protein JW894_10915 [Bacteroidales bacterium]|nr:hypothetical protein [Bacteroidales bacterium]